MEDKQKANSTGNEIQYDKEGATTGPGKAKTGPKEGDKMGNSKKYHRSYRSAWPKAQD